MDRNGNASVPSCSDNVVSGVDGGRRGCCVENGNDLLSGDDHNGCGGGGGGGNSAVLNGTAALYGDDLEDRVGGGHVTTDDDEGVGAVAAAAAADDDDDLYVNQCVGYSNARVNRLLKLGGRGFGASASDSGGGCYVKNILNVEFKGSVQRDGLTSAWFQMLWSIEDSHSRRQVSHDDWIGLYYLGKWPITSHVLVLWQL